MALITLILGVNGSYAAKRSSLLNFRNPNRPNIILNNIIRLSSSTTDEWGKKSWTRTAPPSRHRGNSNNKYNSYNNNNNRKKFPNQKSFSDRPEGSTYGPYDGDHVYGVAPVRLSLLSKRRKIKELLVQKEMKLSKKKDSKATEEILKIAGIFFISRF